MKSGQTADKSMRGICNLVAILLAVPILAAAGDVTVYPVKGVDLAAFKTFQILPIRVLTKRGIVENDPDVSPFIAAAIRSELTKKGLAEVSTSPDLQVLVAALQVQFPTVDGFVYDFSNDLVIGGAPIATVGRYNKEGTVYVNLVNPRDKKSVWLGFASRALGKPSALQGQINKAAGELFKKYPPLK
jgi:Domain of unknown function (DUF4136)